MEVKQIGISYEVNESFENYSITGKIEEFINSDKFNAEFKLKESEKVVLELYYMPGANEDRRTINYFFEDSNKMKQYLVILFNFVLEALNSIPNT